MQLVGWWVYGQESLASKTPVNGVADLQNWKFRSPPGMETKIFEKLGAVPVVMDFTEVFTALETGIIDAADYSGLANNESIGLFDLVSYATYPGFHSMPSDHLACNKNVWDSMPEHHRAIISTAMESLALRTALSFEKLNAEAAARLREAGVTLASWSDEDRQEFRDAAQASWPEFATTPEAEALVESHMSDLSDLGLVSDDGADPVAWLALAGVFVFFGLGVATVRRAPMEYKDWGWFDRVSVFVGRVTMLLIGVLVCVMIYEVFMRYVVERPTL